MRLSTSSLVMAALLVCLGLPRAACWQHQRSSEAAHFFEPPGQCSWHDYRLDLNVSSWEFQLRPAQNVNRTRSEWEDVVEGLLREGQEQLPDFRMSKRGRRTMIWHETAARVSTEDGRPLDPAAAGIVYPWRQVGLLRERLCLAVEAPPGVRHPRHLLKPGQADLTLKLKDVDPATFPRYDRYFPRKVRHARLEVKIENDLHCNYQRASYSATFRRARGLTPARLANLSSVRDYFPTASELLQLPEDWPLPRVLDRYQSKTYWDVHYQGVHGTVQLYLNNTDEADAKAGRQCSVWELSLRLTRRAGEARKGVKRPLNLMADLCELLGRRGWDANGLRSLDDDC